MVILHIANINSDVCNGVCVVAPQHVKAQQQYETVGLINLTGYKYDNVDNQLEFKEPFLLETLPEPLCKPDIVVFHEVYRPKYLKISKVLRKNKIPYVIIPHGELTAGAQKKKWYKKKIANLLLFNKFIKNAIAIQCFSEFEVQSTKFAKTLKIGTNGVLLPDRGKEQFLQEGIKFLYIGRLDMYHKGLDLLLCAVGKVKEYLKENNCKLYIYGPDYKGRFDQVKKAIFDYGVQDIVSLNHEILGQDKIDELLSADYFIQTSRFDTIPTGILFAMSYGVPCVVTEGTSIDQIVELYDAGWTCKTDAESIATAIKQAVSEKDKLKHKSQNAIIAVKENFGWDKIAKETIDKYKTLLG